MVLQIIGSILILVSYFLVQTKKLPSDSPINSAMNVIGSTFLTYEAYAGRQWGFVMLEGSWGLAALYGLITELMRRNKEKKKAE